MRRISVMTAALILFLSGPSFAQEWIQYASRTDFFGVNFPSEPRVKDIVYSSPLYESMKVEQSKVRVSFKHAGSGLEAKGEKLVGFAIAGEDRTFVWADATIDGKTVVVSSDKVAKPVAVRYAWADNPDCNLYNKEGLPASPFRTDDWPTKK